MKELRNIRTSHSLYFLIHDQRGRSHGVAISKKVRWEKSSSPLASRPGTSSLRQRTSSRLGRIPAFYTRGVLREGGPRCWIGAGGGGGGGSQFAWFANLSAVRGAKVGWMEYLPLAATAMLASPPHLGSIQGLMANLAQEYYLKIDKNELRNLTSIVLNGAVIIIRFIHSSSRRRRSSVDDLCCESDAPIDERARSRPHRHDGQAEWSTCSCSLPLSLSAAPAVGVAGGVPGVRRRARPHHDVLRRRRGFRA